MFVLQKVIFANLQQSYSPWLMSEIDFCSISWEWIDRIQPNFYTHYHWQGLGWYFKLSFFANLQRIYDPWLMSDVNKFCIHIDIDEI